jgi:hypothetical protein
MFKQFDEILFVLDNCDDKSEFMITSFLEKIQADNVQVLQFGEHKKKYFASEVFNFGYEHATGDIIQTWACDLVYDPQVYDVITSVFTCGDLVGTVCFRYWNYSVDSLLLQIHGMYENVYRNIIEKIREQARHTGVYAIRRTMRDQIGPFKDIISEYDEYCLRAKRAGWRVLYYPHTKILHLRAGLTPKKQYSQGTARAYIPHYNFIKTLFHSIIHFKPHLLVGYRHAVTHGFFDTGTLSHEYT